MKQQAWPDSIDVFFPPLIQARLRHDVFSGSFGTQKISSHQSHQSCPAWPSPQSSQDPIWNIRSVTGLRPSAAARSCGACLSPWITEAAVARQHNNQKKKDNFENTTSERIASFQMLQWNTQEIDLTLQTWKPVEDRIFIYLLAKSTLYTSHPRIEQWNEVRSLRSKPHHLGHFWGGPQGLRVIPQWPSGPVPCALRKSLGVDSDLVKRMFHQQLVNHHQIFHLNDFNNVKAVQPLSPSVWTAPLAPDLTSPQ